MSAAAVEPPPGDRPGRGLLAVADLITDRLPGLRVEILGGEITVTPPPDGPHADTLTELMLTFCGAGLHGKETRLLQAIGLWLPTGAEDFAVPDLSVVDADYRDHLIEHNCYDPAVFRLVLEVTSSNHKTDLQTKVAVYAAARIPTYMIIDRKNQRVHVLTEPDGESFERHAVYPPGAMFPIPHSAGTMCVHTEVPVDDVLLPAQDR